MFGFWQKPIVIFQTSFFQVYRLRFPALLVKRGYMYQALKQCLHVRAFLKLLLDFRQPTKARLALCVSNHKGEGLAVLLLFRKTSTEYHLSRSET